MSKGHGKTQRWVLDCLSQDTVPRWISVEWLAYILVHQHLYPGCEDMYYEGTDVCRHGDVHPTRSAIESIRRAVKRLASEGHLESAMQSQEVIAHFRVPRAKRVHKDDRVLGDTTRSFLNVRRIPNEEEAKILKEEEARQNKEREALREMDIEARRIMAGLNPRN